MSTSKDGASGNPQAIQESPDAPPAGTAELLRRMELSFENQAAIFATCQQILAKLEEVFPSKKPPHTRR